MWERDTPPAAVRDRQPTGRLDLLTWPSRRIRLHADQDGRVDRLAVHDGDRITKDGWQVQRTLDPMTAWSRSAKGNPLPLSVVSEQGWPQPWATAYPLHSDDKADSAVIAHAVAAAERGVIAPDTRLSVVASCVVHSNHHRASVADMPVLSVPYGDARLLANAADRVAYATAARHTPAVQSNLTKVTAAVARRPSSQVAPRMEMTNLTEEWENVTEEFTHDPQAAAAFWTWSLREAAERLVNAFPARLHERQQILAEAFAFHLKELTPEPPPTIPRPGKPVGRGGRPARTYPAFGGQHTLSQISKLPECKVGLLTLRKRVVDQGWGPEEAALTPARQPRPGS